MIWFWLCKSDDGRMGIFNRGEPEAIECPSEVGNESALARIYEHGFIRL